MYHINVPWYTFLDNNRHFCNGLLCFIRDKNVIFIYKNINPTKNSFKSQLGCYANTTAENTAAQMKESLEQRSATLHRLKNDLCASSGDNSG